MEIAPGRIPPAITPLAIDNKQKPRINLVFFSVSTDRSSGRVLSSSEWKRGAGNLYFIVQRFYHKLSLDVINQTWVQQKPFDSVLKWLPCYPPASILNKCLWRLFSQIQHEASDFLWTISKRFQATGIWVNPSSCIELNNKFKLTWGS